MAAPLRPTRRSLPKAAVLTFLLGATVVMSGCAEVAVRIVAEGLLLGTLIAVSEIGAHAIFTPGDPYYDEDDEPVVYRDLYGECQCDFCVEGR